MLLAITVIGGIGILAYRARKKTKEATAAYPGDVTRVGLNGALLEPRK